IVSGDTLPNLPHRCPVRPKPCEHRKWSGVIESEPHVTAAFLVELTERCERHNASVLDTKPALPMLAVGVANVGGPAVGLHLQQLVKVDGLTLGPEFVRPLTGGFQLSLLRRWHTPAQHCQLAHAIWRIAHHGC